MATVMPYREVVKPLLVVEFVDTHGTLLRNPSLGAQVDRTRKGKTIISNRLLVVLTSVCDKNKCLLDVPTD